MPSQKLRPVQKSAPGLKCHIVGNYMSRLILNGILFVAFPWVVTSTGLGGFMICMFII